MYRFSSLSMRGSFIQYFSLFIFFWGFFWPALFYSEEHTVSVREYCEQIGNIDPIRERIVTFNAYGATYCFNTKLTNAFLEYCEECSTSPYFLEIGAAFGIKSAQIVQRGAYLVANDLDPEHLAVAAKTFEHFKEFNSAFSKVNFVSGNFLELSLEDLHGTEFDALLIESVFHFFTPEEVQKALSRIQTYLKPGGRVFIMVSSPHLLFLHDAYMQNKMAKQPWPGYFADPEEISPELARLHKPYHCFDMDTLVREMKLSGFDILQCEYIATPHHEYDLALDGREGLMLIAEKRDINTERDCNCSRS